MTDARAFVRDGDCPAHDRRCTAALCIMQPEHPKHAEYVAGRDRRMVALDEQGNVLGVSRALTPHVGVRIGTWEESEPGTWRNVENPEDEAWINEGKLCVQATGTYGEGGFVEIPLLVLRMLLEDAGYRIKPPTGS